MTSDYIYCDALIITNSSHYLGEFTYQEAWFESVFFNKY